MPRPLALFLVLLLAALSTYLLWPAAPQEEFAQANETPVVQDSDPSTPDLAEAMDTSALVSDSAPLLRTETESAAPPAAETNAPLPAVTGENAITVWTRDRLTGEPLPHTEVYALYPNDHDEAELQAKFQSGNYTLEQVCVEYGLHYRSDENGRTAVKRPLDASAVLFGRKDHQTTLAFNLSPNDSDWILQLEPDFSVDVLVTNAAGEPAAAVPMALKSRSENFEFNLMSQLTDEQGVAHFKNLNVFFQGNVGPSGDMFLGLSMLLPSEAARDTKYEIPITLDDVGMEQQHLWLPEHGSVRVRMVDPEGELVDEDCTAVLAPYEEDSDSGFRIRQNLVNTKAIQGIAEFPYVALQEKLLLSVANQSGLLDEYQEIAGPTQIGEVVEIDFVIENNCVLIGTLQFENGDPVASQKLALTYRWSADGRQESTRMRLQTDAVGGFRLPLLRKDLAQQTTDRELNVLLPDPKGASLHSVIALPAKLPRGELDLGVQKMLAMPQVVGGLILDMNHTPVANALVKLESKTTLEEHDYHYWSTVQGGQTRSNGIGEFAIYSDTKGQELQVVVTAPTFMKETIPIDRGQTDLKVHLKQAAQISGMIHLDADIPASQFSVNVRVTSNLETRTYFHFNSDLSPIVDQRGSYSYSLKELPAGDGVISLAASNGQTLMTVDSIPLKLGLDCTPPEWKQIDLRGRLKQLELRLLDPNGDPLRSSASAYFENGTEVEAVATTIELFAFEAIPTLSIRADGFRDQNLQSVFQSQDVRLDLGWEVQLRIPTQYAQHNDCKVIAKMTPASNENLVASVDSEPQFNFPSRRRANLIAPFQLDGTATLRIPISGQYHVSLRLSSTSESNGRRSSTHLSGSTNIVVKEQIGVQSFTLQIDETEFNEAISSLRD